jgi:PKD repeat protein
MPISPWRIVQRKRLVPIASATLLLASASLIGSTAPATAADPFSFAVIGDVPYGSNQLEAFPRQIEQINADGQVQVVSHLGDISSPLNCSDAYFSTIKSQFDRFVDPIAYTPGDNEWADCHRADIGAGNPLDRLSAVRRTFFPTPGTTLGQNKMSVTAQSGYPENVRWNQDSLSFATVHIVGSNNDLNAWAGNSGTTSAQRAEVTARTSAGISHIRSAFAAAKANGSRAVVLITQADMFKPGTVGATYKTAFQSTVQAIASESASFQRPVFLINGDTHAHASDKPLTLASWKSFYGVTSSVSNLSRITIKGGTEWTKFNLVPTSSVLQVQRVPLATAPTNAAPTASFTSSTSGLTANVNGSGSTDSNGTIASHAWNFGDGSTATGATASRTYAAAGTYTITLTVTDNAGATGTVSHPVTVTSAGEPPPPPPPPPPPAASALATDSFTRTVTGGLGSADSGGAWATSGTAANFTVDGTAAKVALPRGSNRYAFLNGVSSSSTEVRTTVSFERPSASSIYAGVIARRVGTADYGARVVVSTSGSTQLQLLRTTDTVLRSSTISGLTFASGDRLQLRFQAVDTSPTTLQAKVWKAGTAEPANWLVNITDSTAALQAAGAVGLYGYLSSSATPTSLAVSYDDFWAGTAG